MSAPADPRHLTAARTRATALAAAGWSNGWDVSTVEETDDHGPTAIDFHAVGVSPDADGHAVRARWERTAWGSYRLHRATIIRPDRPSAGVTYAAALAHLSTRRG